MTGARASHEHRKIGINLDGSLRACAEVNKGHESRRREPTKKLIDDEPSRVEVADTKAQADPC